MKMSCRSDYHLWNADTQICLCGRIRSVSWRFKQGQFELLIALRLPVVSRWVLDLLRDKWRK